jgi:integrase
MRQGDLFKTPSATSFASVIQAYRLSPKFQALARATKVSYDYAFRIASNPAALGNISIKEIRPALMQAFIDGFADRPATQRSVRTAFLALQQWAIVRDLLPRPIMTGTEASNASESYEPWTDEHVRIAELHARPDLARMVTLAVNTGQRGSDLVRMKWTDLSEHPASGRSGINVVQQKTGRKLWIPLTIELELCLNNHSLRGWDRSLGYLVTKQDGTPYTRPQLSDAWTKERIRNPALAPHRALGLSFHGLRAAAVIRLQKANIETRLIANFVGMSDKMVERYASKASQPDNAIIALDMMQGTGPERSNVVPLPKRPASD